MNSCVYVWVESQEIFLLYFVPPVSTDISLGIDRYLLSKNTERLKIIEVLQKCTDFDKKNYLPSHYDSIVSYIIVSQSIS